MVEKILFIVFAVLAVGGALGVITRTNIIHALMMLVFTFMNVAAIFLLTQAYFLAVVQILVYAGAIMVLFLFVIMFLNLREFSELEQVHPTQKWAVLIVTPIMLAEFVYVLAGLTAQASAGEWAPEVIQSVGGNAKAMGVAIFNDMMLPFEVAGLILLVAMVGAVVLGRKEDNPNVALGRWGSDADRSAEILEQEV